MYPLLRSFFADDVIKAMSHPRKENLEEEAWIESDDFEDVLQGKGLGSTRGKSSNFLPSPGETEGSFFRREPNAHRASAMEKKKRDAEKALRLEASSEEEDKDETKRRSTLPYPKVDK